MSLGARLIFAFLAVAFVPAGAVLAFTWFTVEERFQEEFRDRLDGVAEGIQAGLGQMGRQIQRKVQTLSESDEIQNLLVDMATSRLDRLALVDVAGKWMTAWDLDLLCILDGKGTVLSSGHLRARSGSRDEESYQIATRRPLTPTIREVQVSRGRIIENILAVVVGTSRRSSRAEVLVVGGKLLDEAFVAELENLSGATIQIVDRGDRILAGQGGDASDPDSTWVGDEAVTYRRVALPPGESEEQASAFILAGVSATKLKDAQRRIVIASVGAAVAGVFISWLLGLLISRRILSPVHALVRGARYIAKGELEHRVHQTSSGEIGELVRTFNRMAEDLTAYRQRLVRAERVAAWQEIARRIAHEIKNPLSPIQMSIETLRKAYAGGHSEFKEIFQESTQAILEEVAALRRIVSEFSEFARLPKPTMTVQDLNAVVESTLNLYRNEAGGERLQAQLQPGLPPVEIDREQIGRVVANLISNALWAVGPQGTVQVITAEAHGRVLLRVVDDGCGMNARVLEKVFTPYFTTRKNGTGLGLAIVQRVVEDHGGNIEVESSEDRGTSLTISFPAARK